MARFLVIAAASGIGQATVSLLEAAGHPSSAVNSLSQCFC